MGDMGIIPLVAFLFLIVPVFMAEGALILAVNRWSVRILGDERRLLSDRRRRDRRNADYWGADRRIALAATTWDEANPAYHAFGGDRRVAQRRQGERRHRIRREADRARLKDSRYNPDTPVSPFEQLRSA